MNIVKQEREIELNGENFIMTFDNTSIPVFKQLTGRSFLKSTARLGQLEDDVIIGFVGATLRPILTPDTPIGDKVYDYSTLGILTTFSDIVIELVTSSMPQSTGGITEKK